MRIRVASTPPLPLLRVWYPLPESTPPRASTSRLPAQQLLTIQSLKQRLCSDLKALHDAPVRPEEIILLMDDFELLDSSGVDVLRDGDLIWCGAVPLTAILCELTDLTW